MDNVAVNHRVPQNAEIRELNFDPELDTLIFPLLSSLPYHNRIIKICLCLFKYYLSSTLY